MADSYLTLAADYDWLFDDDGLTGGDAINNPATARLLQATSRGSAVLDASCGTGLNAAVLARRGFDVWATDGSEAMIEQAAARFRREHLAIPVRHCLWADLPVTLAERFRLPAAGSAGMVSRMELHPLQTARLRLEPLTMETARAILAGDLSGLTAAGLAAADGWPHEDTADGLAGAVKAGYPPGWLITAGGVVIGDLGTHGPVDEAGRVEIGYGLAAPSRGQGYGSEAVLAVTDWLLRQPEVRQVQAHTLTDNMPSRRVLEKAGFRYLGLDEGEALYQRT